MSEFNMQPDIDAMLEYHIGKVYRYVAASDYRSAWKHAWIITAALYYKCRADHMQQLVDNDRRRPF